jgi:prepilin-type N-terminal cleavage/methylation domain-containing protein
MRGHDPSRTGGFTLVELSVVIVLVSILASFAVPKFRSAVERSRAGEAFNYLSAVRAAQERYVGRQGIYAARVSFLDIKMPRPLYFTVGDGSDDPEIGAGDTGDLQDSWALTLTRRGASAGYGAYTVIFGDDGFDAAASTISTNATLHQDINPTVHSM